MCTQLHMRMSYIGFISGKAEKKIGKIIHNYFCYSKKGE